MRSSRRALVDAVKRAARSHAQPTFAPRCGSCGGRVTTPAGVCPACGGTAQSLRGPLVFAAVAAGVGVLLLLELVFG